MKFELTKEELEIVEQLLDVALRAGGMHNKPAVDKLLQVFSMPISETNNKEDANL